MCRILLVLILLLESPINGQTQPFDTLLAQFNYIEDIYPLHDSTYILVGTNENEILVERINHKAEVVWSTHSASIEKDYLKRIRYTLHGEDSLIQIATADKDCDAYGNSLHKAFTIDFSGNLIDSQRVSFGDDNGAIFLLSGSPGQPRLAYLANKKTIVMLANGDTLELNLTWQNGDTTNSWILGSPRLVTICPNGDILVGTNTSIFLRYRLDNNHFNVIDQTLTFGSFNDLLCLDEQLVINIGEDYLTLFDGDIPTTSYYFDDSFILSTSWKDSLFTVYPTNFIGSDTVYFFTKYLEVIHKQTRNQPTSFNMAIQDGITYNVGSGNTYFDHGSLVSEDHSTQAGPLYYDVAFVDFQPGPYDSATWQTGPLGGHYLYHIPKASVTLKNNCTYPINEVTIQYRAPKTFCTDTFWAKELKSIDLNPNETKTFDIYDIFLRLEYSGNSNRKVCLDAISPDHRLDDFYDDNEWCMVVDLVSTNEEQIDYSIFHSPSIITNDITFHGPSDFEFELTIYSYNGMPVYKGKTNTNSGTSLDLSFLPAGFYLFNYQLPNLGKQSVEKILKY